MNNIELVTVMELIAFSELWQRCLPINFFLYEQREETIICGGAITRGSKGAQEGGFLASARKESLFIVSSSSNLQVNNGNTA